MENMENMKNLIEFIKTVVSHRQLIVTMARRELKARYVGSLLGLAWNLIHPIVMISVFWFVFDIGFRSKPLNDVPFVVWLAAGMAPWFIFSEIVTNSSAAVLSNSNLIKKTLFHSQILPVVKVVTSFITHGVFLLVLFALLLVEGMAFNLFFFQFLYYLFGLVVFGMGIGWAVSALNVFVRDIAQVVAVVIQVGFWATPIFWNINIMPPKVQLVLKLNPVFYLVQGYRESFITFIPFWHHPVLTVYFWLVALFTFVIGALIFRRLQPQFADVL